MQNIQTSADQVDGSHFRSKLLNGAVFFVMCGLVVYDGYLLKCLLSSVDEDQNKAKKTATSVGFALAFAGVTTFIILSEIYFVKNNRRMRSQEKEQKDNVSTMSEELQVFINKQWPNLDNEDVMSLASLLKDVNIVQLCRWAQSDMKAWASLKDIFMMTPNDKVAYENALKQEHDFSGLKIELLKEAYLQAFWQQLWQGCFLTALWLGVGAFGWEIFIQSLASFAKWPMDYAFLDDPHWGQKMALWLSAGLGSYLFLIAGMVSGIMILSSFFGGRPLHEYQYQVKQFALSVIGADMWWLLFAGLPAVILKIFDIEASQGLIFILSLITFLVEAFLFRNLQNIADKTPSGQNKAKWSCDITYTTLLWFNYLGFGPLADWFRFLCQQLPPDSTVFITMFYIALIGAFSAALPPLVLDLGVIFDEHAKASHAWETMPVFSKQASAFVTDLEAQTEDNEMSDAVDDRSIERLLRPQHKTSSCKKVTSYVKEGAKTGLIFFTNGAIGIVQLARDLYPNITRKTT